MSGGCRVGVVDVVGSDGDQSRNSRNSRILFCTLAVSFGLHLLLAGQSLWQTERAGHSLNTVVTVTLNKADGNSVERTQEAPEIPPPEEPQAPEKPEPQELPETETERHDSRHEGLPELAPPEPGGVETSPDRPQSGQPPRPSDRLKVEAQSLAKSELQTTEVQTAATESQRLKPPGSIPLRIDDGVSGDLTGDLIAPSLRDKGFVMLADADLQRIDAAQPGYREDAREQRLFNRYLAAMEKQIMANWPDDRDWPRGLSGKIRFELDDSGLLLKAYVQLPSSSAEFDRQVLSAVRAVTRYAVPDDPEVVRRYYSVLSFYYDSNPQDTEQAPWESGRSGLRLSP